VHDEEPVQVEHPDIGTPAYGVRTSHDAYPEGGAKGRGWSIVMGARYAVAAGTGPALR
jgi:hypothetical protein